MKWSGHAPRRTGGIALGVLASAGCAGDSFSPPAGFESPRPGVVLDLEPGERLTVTVSDARGSIEIPAVPETRSYLVVVHDTRTDEAGPIDVRFHTRRVPTTFVTNQVPAAGSSGEQRRSARRAADPFDRWYLEGELRFRSRVARDLRAVGARPATPRASSAAPGVRASISASVPVAGDLIDFGSPVREDGSLATCTSTTRITGRVRAVGPHFAVVEDTLVAGPFSQNDFMTVLNEIESVAYPVDSVYFGTPSDIDGNGRVIALITGEVNRLGAAGFFTNSDLADATDCPTSNEGEVLWLIAPDPTRQHGFDPIPTNLVRERIAGVIAHELQHLIHLERRVFEGGGDLDSADLPWLNEGLSHIAEEVSGFFVAGRRTGQNYALEDIGTATGAERFLRYHLSDFRFMREYFEDTSSVPVLIDGPVTRGQLQKARGFGYLFLRWLADRYAAEGAPGIVSSMTEEALFRELTIGGSGLEISDANVVAALSGIGVQTSWQELLAAYVGVPALDDLTPRGLDLARELQITSWNFPLAYQNAADNGFDLDFPNGFPLKPTLLLLGTLPIIGFTEDIRLLPSASAYFRLEGIFDTPLTTISVTGGEGVSSSEVGEIRITIIRTA
ncbi:MAG: hypothetical protein OEU54_12725 [Gemmatimonadota bacterium]|nr:hypothetical protein [Gemmatimonadota bacterium]